jgi:FdhD protein
VAGRRTAKRPIVRNANGVATRAHDELVVEEPLEIRLDGVPLAVTMRTPGDDFDLTLGFLLTEGIIRAGEDVRTIEYCAGSVDGRNTYNVLDVTRAAGAPEHTPASVARNFYTTSSCGVCGKASIDAVRTTSAYDPSTDDVRVPAGVLSRLPDALRRNQRVFASTGGLHAAGLFTPAGDLIAVREDVGRHNAVDKLIGDAVRREAVPARGQVLLVSGRASFELVQKALMAGIPMLAAVSAPSSLAVELAAESGMTLVAFLRGDSMNVYTGAERVPDTGDLGTG